MTTLAATADNTPDPLARVNALRALAAATSAALDRSVTEARAAGSSWAAIGANLAVSKQAAAKRFAPIMKPTTPIASDRFTEPAHAGSDQATQAAATADLLKPPARPAKAVAPKGWDVATRRGFVFLKVRRPR